MYEWWILWFVPCRSWCKVLKPAQNMALPVCRNQRGVYCECELIHWPSVETILQVACVHLCLQSLQFDQSQGQISSFSGMKYLVRCWKFILWSRRKYLCWLALSRSRHRMHCQSQLIQVTSGLLLIEKIGHLQGLKYVCSELDLCFINYSPRKCVFSIHSWIHRLLSRHKICAHFLFSSVWKYHFRTLERDLEHLNILAVGIGSLSQAFVFLDLE